MPPKALIAWYGSLQGHGTVGDLLSMQSVTQALSQAQLPFVHVSATSDEGIEGTNIALGEVDPREIGVLVFVCGPVIRNHQVGEALFGRFPDIRRIGVGVSVLPPDNPLHDQPFDVIFAREGWAEPFEDVAIVAPSAGVPAPTRRPGPQRVGLALRGFQPEYGTCLNQRVDDLVKQTLQRLTETSELEVVEIEHHLVRAGMSAHAVEALYADCDLIITSRYHGGVFALRQGVPFLAIDQIEGGAKVLNLLGGRGWPHVFAAAETSADQLAEAARRLLRDEDAPLLCDTADRMRDGARATLARLAQAVAESLA